MRGGERVLEHFCALFPHADLFTLLYEPSKVSRTIRRMNVIESPFARIPKARRHYRHLLPLMPSFIKALPTPDYDLVLSTSHCVAKGARPPARGAHLSYVFSPMRYVWDHFPDYLGESVLKNTGLRVLRPFMQRWDRESCSRVDAFACDSDHIGRKIRDFWGREAVTIYPPVELDRFQPDGQPPDDYFLVVAAMVPYKKIHRAIEGARLAKKRLVIVGGGPEEARLRRLAGPEVEFAGKVSDADLPRYYQRCRALLYPGVEDFGITSLEAQACGRPVIALGIGGAAETVKDGVTGVHFQEPTAKSLARAMRSHDDTRYDGREIRRWAESFSPAAFRASLLQWIENETRFTW